MSEMPIARPPRTYLGWSLAATVLCFLPLGLVAVYHGYRAAQAIDAGDTEAAGQRSRRARRWLVATLVVGALVDLLLVAVLVLMGAFAS
jgi:uncharacterized membrane protein